MYSHHNPVQMGFVKGLADAVHGLTDIFSGGPQKRARAARAAQASAEEVARIESQTSRDMARMSLAREQEKSETILKFSLIAGGTALIGLVAYLTLRD